jgi:hypothetical protein
MIHRRQTQLLVALAVVWSAGCAKPAQYEMPVAQTDGGPDTPRPMVDAPTGLDSSNAASAPPGDVAYLDSSSMEGPSDTAVPPVDGATDLKVCSTVDPSACGIGASCTVCAQPMSHGKATCQAGKCGLACDQGYWPCAGQCAPLTTCPFTRLAGNTDPQGDWLSAMPRPAHADIASTAVRVDGDHLIFEMELHAAVPVTPPQTIFYGWFIDTDLNMGTGQKYNDIGSDFNVQLDYRLPRGWAGLVYNIAAGGRETFTAYATDGSKVVLAVPLSAIGNARRFRYVSVDQVDDGLGYADTAPNSGHIMVTLP